jgi:hypothetical protein
MPSVGATYNQRVIDKLVGEPTKQRDAVEARRARTMARHEVR